MPSSFTSRIGLEQQATGEGNNVWGANLNSNVIGLIEDAIAGLTSVALTASDVILTKANGTPDQSRAAILYLHGTLGANVAVVVPSVTKAYVVDNNTTGAFSATVRTAGGSGVTVPQGTAQTLYVTGTSVIATSPAVSAAAAQVGTAAYLNIGTSVNELTPVSIADARYARVSAGVEFTQPVGARTQSYSVPVTLAYSTSINVNMALGDNFLVSLAGNSNLVPINQRPGQSGAIWLVQATPGNSSVTWSPIFAFPASIRPTLTSTVGAVDVIPFLVRSSVAIDCGFLGDSR